MGEHPPSPHLMPPPPPSSLSKSHLPILYYGLVVVGTAAIVLVLYNLIVLKWCTDFSARQRDMITGRRSTSRRYQDLNLELVSSFRYKGGLAAKDMRNDSECAVCLSVFEEGEEVRQLPICRHSFHAPCIDMWLYSHMNCPICRCPVEPPVLQQSAAVGQLERPPQGFQARSMLV